ncbi:MAG: hypothetical protein NTX03_03115 [Bacteroidetes bacterium]|nr:hypothetical protein [Bacteroidota bacterium]
MIKIVTTNSNKFVEARLRFKNIAATHFLIFVNNKLFDEGIDGEEREVSIDDFVNHYENCYWQIDNLV